MSGLHTSPKFSGFIRRLVEEGHLSASNMQNAIDAAKKAQQDIVAHLIEHQRLSPLTVAESISLEFGEPLFDLAVYDQEEAVGLIAFVEQNVAASGVVFAGAACDAGDFVGFKAVK